MVIFVTLWAALLVLLGVGILLLWSKNHERSDLLADIVKNSGGIAVLVAQALSLTLLGYTSPIIRNMSLAFLVFSILGFLSQKVPDRMFVWLLILAVSLCIPLQDSSTFLPGLGMIEISRGYVTICNCLSTFIMVWVVKSADKIEGFLSGTFLGVWSVLFLFFSKTAFGAQWGWDYALLEAISAAHVGALSTFLIFNSAPALLGLGVSGSCGLAGGLAICLCELRCPLILFGLLSIPLIQSLFPGNGLQYLRRSGYSDTLIAPLLTTLNTIVAAFVLKGLNALSL